MAASRSISSSSSSSSSSRDDWVNASVVKLEDACFASGFVDELRGYLELWADDGGLTAFEFDGPYGGGVCASESHTHHHGALDSVFSQGRQTEALLTWLVTKEAS